MNKHLKNLSDAFVTAFLLFFGVACLLKYGASVDDFITSSIVGLGLMLLTFAIALKSIDPITKEAVNAAEEARWLPVEKSVLEFTQSAAYIATTHILITFYGFYHSRDLLNKDSPHVKTLMYKETRESPEKFVELSTLMCNELLRIYNNTVDIKLHSDLTDEKIKLLRESIEKLLEAWRLYSANPTADPQFFNRLTKIVIAFGQIKSAEQIEDDSELSNLLKKAGAVRGFLEICPLTIEIYDLARAKLKI